MYGMSEETSPLRGGQEMESRFSRTAYYSVVLERSAIELWSVIRDFNSYPIG